VEEDIYKKIQDYLRLHSKIEKATIFGSRAKGNASRGSDIDIALSGKDLRFIDLCGGHEQLFISRYSGLNMMEIVSQSTTFPYSCIIHGALCACSLLCVLRQLFCFTQHSIVPFCNIHSYALVSGLFSFCCGCVVIVIELSW